MHVFVESSGWYRVESATTTGAVFVTLLATVIAPPDIIEAGRLVLPAGAQGLSTPGAQGATGPKGQKGDQGSQGLQGAPGLPGLPAPVSGTTDTNGQYHDDAGTIHTNPGTGPAWTEVDFTSSKPFVTLPNAGVYLISATTGTKNGTGDCETRLFNVTTAAAVAGTLGVNASSNIRIIPITAVLTTTGAEVVRLEAYGKNAKIYPDNTTITYVQLA
jgi:hypothetical protein